MMCIVHFREDPNASIAQSLPGLTYIQGGRGMIFWSEGGGGKPHLFCDGKEIDYEKILCGCKLVTNAGFAYRISGTDYNDQEWFVRLGDGLAYKKVCVKENEICLNREQISELFRGTPFTIVISKAFARLIREQNYGKLCDEKRFAKNARKTLKKILSNKGKDSPRLPGKIHIMLWKLLVGH